LPFVFLLYDWRFLTFGLNNKAIAFDKDKPHMQNLVIFPGNHIPAEGGILCKLQPSLLSVGLFAPRSFFFYIFYLNGLSILTLYPQFRFI